MTAEAKTPMCCAECRRPWRHPCEPWRADWVDDTDELYFWCPACWVREFQAD